MREACIIVPQKGNRGEDLTTPLNDLETALINAFNGWTRVHGAGAWRVDRPTTRDTILEHVWVYTIAAADSPTTTETLVRLAKQFRDTAKQESVYVRFPSGNTRLL